MFCLLTLLLCLDISAGRSQLAGTKCDLAPPRVGEHEARAWATKNDMSFLQVILTAKAFGFPMWGAAIVLLISDNMSIAPTAF